MWKYIKYNAYKGCISLFILYCLITCNIKSLLNVPKISHISRKTSQVSRFPAKSPDSRNKFVFLPKQPLLELSPPVYTTVQFLGGSCRKFIQRLETCLLWQLKLTEFFCQLVMFFTVFFHWIHKMKYSCYQQSSVIHGWFVYWIFDWEMRRLSKLEIRFRMASFSFFHLAGCGLKSPSSDSGLTW